MYRVEKMHIADIIDQTNLFITPQSLCEIWKPREQIKANQYKPSAWDLIRNDKKLISQLMEDEYKLYAFLLEHDSEIDKLKFLMVALRNYKQRLYFAEKYRVKPEEMKDIKDGIEGIKRLLKGVNETYVFYDVEDNTNKITQLMIINSAEEVQGIERKNRNSNSQRLREIEEELELDDIAQGILAYDIEHTLAFDKKVGQDMRYMAEYNTIINEYGSDFRKMEGNLTATELAERYR